jgi:peptidyl-tRNA hydrolase, PTH1 family
VQLIAGLGNPGASRANNRHNIGFMAADEIARRHNFGPWRKKFNGELAEGQIDGRKVLLLKPQTYMNRSGEPVGEAIRYFNISPENLTVLYDELDLPPGKLRVRTGGGAGGHNGIRSLNNHCGNNFKRIRLGIGHPGDKSQVKHHVLGDFAKSDREWLLPLLQAVAENISLSFGGDDSSFMNRVTLTMRASEPARTAPRAGGDTGSDQVRQARRDGASAEAPRGGALAAMLARLLGHKKE